jgi:hypothetical protein
MYCVGIGSPHILGNADLVVASLQDMSLSRLLALPGNAPRSRSGT